MLSLEINTIENLQQIILSGQLEGLEALEFRRKINHVIEETNDSVLVDLQAISEIDLTGFNALVMLKNETEKRQMSFHILAPSDGPLDEYLHLSKLDLNKTIAAS